MMHVSEAIASRRSVRAFLDKPVDLTVLHKILCQAARAPSGGNIQPWHIHVLAGDKMRRFKQLIATRLASDPRGDGAEYDVYPKILDATFKARIENLGAVMYESLGIPREDKTARRQWFMHNYQFFGAPVGLFCFVQREHGPPQWSDLGMYLQNVMLLLRAHGMDSCPQECWTIFAKTIYEFLNIPAGQMLFTGMSIGWRDENAAVNRFPVPRVGPEEFLKFHESD